MTRLTCRSEESAPPFRPDTSQISLAPAAVILYIRVAVWTTKFQMRRLRRRLNRPRLTSWGVINPFPSGRGSGGVWVVFNPFQGFFPRRSRISTLGSDASERTLLHAVDHPCAYQKNIRKLFIVRKRTRTNAFSRVLRTDHASRLSKPQPQKSKSSPNQSKAVAHDFFHPISPTGANSEPLENEYERRRNAYATIWTISTKSAFTTAIRHQNKRLSVTNGKVTVTNGR
jgi:hypothetical protein